MGGRQPPLVCGVGALPPRQVLAPRRPGLFWIGLHILYQSHDSAAFSAELRAAAARLVARDTAGLWSDADAFAVAAYLADLAQQGQIDARDRRDIVSQLKPAYLRCPAGQRGSTAWHEAMREVLNSPSGDEKFSFIEEAAQARPDVAQFQMDFAEQLREREGNEAARTWLEQAIPAVTERQQRQDLLQHYVDFAAEEGLQEQALDAFHRWIALAGDDPPLEQAFLQLLCQQGRYDEARQRMQDAFRQKAVGRMIAALEFTSNHGEPTMELLDRAELRDLVRTAVAGLIDDPQRQDDLTTLSTALAESDGLQSLPPLFFEILTPRGDRLSAGQIAVGSADAAGGAGQRGGIHGGPPAPLVVSASFRGKVVVGPGDPGRAPAIGQMPGGSRLPAGTAGRCPGPRPRHVR